MKAFLTSVLRRRDRGPGFQGLQALTAAVLAAALAPACSEMGQQNIFEPEVGHPESWVADHGEAALSDGGSCPDCHGPDLSGGVSGLSCFTLNFNDGGCHESGGELRHTEGWALPREHGRAATSRPGVSSGLGSCQACHGIDYDGGTSEVPCSSCHGVEAPHPPAPWLEGLASHEKVHELNAHFCADCHSNDESTDLPDCFNGSLCHGEKGAHAADWSLAENHGASAMDDPLLGGLEECVICHGDDFEGGTSGVSCLTCHGMPAVHPSAGWAEGGLRHQDVHEGNAAACAACHLELEAPGGCFAANACHEAGVPEELPEDPPPPEEGTPEEAPPPEDPPPPEAPPPPEEPPPEAPPPEEPPVPLPPAP